MRSEKFLQKVKGLADGFGSGKKKWKSTAGFFMILSKKQCLAETEKTGAEL